MIYFIFILISSIAFSQDTDEVLDSAKLAEQYRLRPKFGAFGHFSLNFHQTDFIRMISSTDNCCPGYEYGSGSSFASGILMELPFENYFNGDFFKKSDISLRLGYSGYDGELIRYENTDVIVNGNSQTGEFKHLFDFNYGTIGIEPGIAYQVINDLRIYAGLRIGFHFYDYFYTIETISEPKNMGTFLNGQTYRAEDNGKIDNVQKIQFAPNIGIGYELPLNQNGSLFLQPEAFYSLNVTPVIKDNFWLVHNIQIGIALKYKKPLPPPPEPDPPIAPPIPKLPLPAEAPEAFVDIDAIKIDSAGNKSENFNLKIEDFVSLNMRPLLNYIFFEDSSSAIPERYNLLNPANASQFSLMNLHGLDAMDTYYHVLNIIGKRMKEMPNTNVTLIGTNSNNGSEKGNIELSKARAETVKSYLTKIWNIKPNRIITKARNLPKQPTRQDEPDGIEENRRVEIIPNDWSLVEAVVTQDTMRVINKSDIQFIPEVKSPMGVNNWSIIAKMDNRVLYSKNGYEYPDDDYIWTISNKSENIPETSGNIQYSISISDSLGQSFSSETKVIPVEQLTVDRKRLERIEDKEFEYYSLILFDFGTTNLELQHRNVVDLVKSRISQKAKVYIYGYSDKLGDEEINQRISTRRARAVARRLNIPGAVVEGKGESELLYDNDLPEGRFYCRTVQIIIETPVEKE